MHDRSSPSVSVEYLNKDVALSSLRKATESLKRDPNVVVVKLFGSLLRGDYVPGSDADILIVLQEDNRRLIDRIPEYLEFFKDVPLSVDVFPYTVDEIERMKKNENFFIKEFLDTGVEL